MIEYTVEQKKLGPFFAIYNEKTKEILSDFEKMETEEWSDVKFSKKGKMKIEHSAFAFKSEKKARKIIKFFDKEYKNKKLDLKVVKFYNLKKTVNVDYMEVEVL